METGESSSGSSTDEVLRGICHAFGSTPNLREGLRVSTKWIRMALASPDAPVRISLPDRGGHLRSVISKGEPWTVGRRRSARRRSVFQTKRPIHVHLGMEDHWLALIPLVARGRVLGVVEVIAPSESLRDRAAALEAVISQTAILIFNLKRIEELTREIEALERPSHLIEDLLRAGTAERAVRTAVRFVRDRYDVPVAGWYGAPGDAHLALTCAFGLGTRRTRDLRKQMSSVPLWDVMSERRRKKLVRQFAVIADVQTVSPISGGGTVLLVGGGSSWMQEPLQSLQAALTDIVGHLAVVAEADRRKQQMTLGLALTAHEMRVPLLGAKAAIESVLAGIPGSAPLRTRELLLRSGQELKDLAELVDGLLRWSVGSASLYRRPTDLGEIVREAVDVCRRGGEDRIVLSLRDHPVVRADAMYLRAAFANILRNALAYAGSYGPISVTLGVRRGVAEIRIKDRGPGVPESDRQSIFDPFVRGMAGRNARDGVGLGLFVARRVVEAHEGSIELESNGQGATFLITLPVESSELAASGSTVAEATVGT